MPTAEERAAVSRRRLRKFMNRTGGDFGQPIVAMRDSSGRIPIGTLHWESVDGENWRVAAFEKPALEKRLLDSVIVESRPLFLPGEDSYLPEVVTSLQSLHTMERARERRPLRDHVAQVVTGKRIAASGPVFHSGRLEMDNGLGPGVLLGSDQIAMDYIYGVALHEDDDRIARLANVEIQTAIEAVVYHLNDLLQVVSNVRRQIDHDVATGYITIDE